MANNETAASPFFANAVHELRTPIQTIIGTLELMGDTTLNPEQTEYVRQVKFSADILLALVNDLLDFSKIQSGQFKLEHIPVNPSHVVEQTVDLISIEAHNRGLEIFTSLSQNTPLAIYSDPTRIQQILLNLVKNAVKFTSQGYINVKLSKVDNNLLFEVVDTGIGVPEEKKQLIFKEFQQADASTTRKFGGTGLGLSICKNLAALMKGDIGIRDNPKGGSVFWFTLPIEKCENPPDSLPRFTKLNINPNTKILVVDDHKLALESLVNKLDSIGLKNVDVALSGEEALDKLRSATQANSPYTLALIDMIMPVMDGWRLAAEINNNKRINASKLFLLAPEGEMCKEAKMKILGWFNGYLYKPIKMQNLISFISENQDEIVDLEVVQEQVSTIETKMKILAAEDHPVNRKLLTTFLKQFNSEVFEAENGKEALDIIKSHPDIDMIFMDIQMPIINGIESTIEIRKLAYDGIIIACTANTDTNDFEEYQKAGMNDILIKPFKKQDIQNMINKWNSVIKISATENNRRKKYSFTEKFELPDYSVNELWDKIDFLDTVSNDISLAQKLIDEYIAQTRILLIQSKDALYHNNFEELAKIAHKLKGSSSTISAKSLYSTAYQMEKYSKEKLTSEVINSISKFATLFSRFVTEVKNQKEDWKK